MGEIKHFLPARQAGPDLPLERYLDPLPVVLLQRYLDSYTGAGDLVLDPVAQRPALPPVAAQLDRKAIVSNFNPINTLLIETALTLPDPEQIDAATTRLGDSPKRGLPLREHIDRLYASTCGHCSNPVVAEYFLWDTQEGGPVQKQYHCPRCAQEGEFPVEDKDLRLLETVESQGIHYWYLLERLAQPHERERPLAEELLQLYTPRNLYALVNISMKIEVLFAASPLQQVLQLILLSCLDSCSKLAGAPLPRASTLRLQPPQRFVERNVWSAFEEAYRAVRRLAPAPPLDLAHSAQQLLEDKVHALVLNQPVRRLAATLPEDSVSLVIGVPQDYYRPFWTLSYLWSGWLWGRAKAAPLRPLLRKIMGWTWYRRTLSAALRSLHRPLRPGGQMVFLLEDADLAHVSNLILASLGASFRMEDILLQPVEADSPRHAKQGVPGAYRLAFTRDATPQAEPEQISADDLGQELRQTALRAITQLLEQRGQGLHFSWLHAAVWALWAQEGLLRQALALERELSAADFLEEEMETALDQGLEEGLLELVPQEPDQDSSPQVWWLRGRAYPSQPLADRAEGAVREVLGEKGLSREEFEDYVYAQFPGLLTPEAPLIDRCLGSYGSYDLASGAWLLRPEDMPESLSQERVHALQALTTVGRRLGYQVTSPHGPGPSRGKRPLPKGIDVSWEENGGLRQLFAVRQTTRFGDLLAQRFEDRAAIKPYIVIAERRGDLLSFRMQTEPLLTRAVADGRWRFIKLNNLRALAAREELRREDLEHIVGLQPVTESPDAQLSLFS